MMVIHIALFRWKKGVSKRQIEKIFKDIEALKKRIKGLKDIYSGENFSKWAKGFTHVIVVTAKDRVALNTYRKHPDHIILANKIEMMEERSLGVDFENQS